MNICIELPENLYNELLKKAKIAQIPAQKIIEIYLIENFFKQKNIVKNDENDENRYFLEKFKEKFKELEITQKDLSDFFKIAPSSISKVLNGKLHNFVFKELKRNRENISQYLKEVYLEILKNYIPNSADSDLIELKNMINNDKVYDLFLGFVNKKLDRKFNEVYFLKYTNINELIKDLKEINIENLSAEELHDKFEYIYLKHYDFS